MGAPIAPHRKVWLWDPQLNTWLDEGGGIRGGRGGGGGGRGGEWRGEGDEKEEEKEVDNWLVGAMAALTGWEAGVVVMIACLLSSRVVDAYCDSATYIAILAAVVTRHLF